MKFIVFVSIVFLIHLPAQANKVLISTIAQVKSHVITSREVSIHQLVNKAIGEAEFSEKDSNEQVIREWLLFFEASTFYSTGVNSKEVASKVEALQVNLATHAEWKKLLVTKQELGKKIRRYLEAQRLYSFKKKASALPVTPAEIETEYTQNRIRYGSKSFAEAKEQIRQNKIKESLADRMQRWFVVLEKKYKVQRFAKYNKL